MTALDIATKRCSACGEVKPLSEFSRCKGNRDGLQYSCKTCDRTKALERQTRLRESIGDEAYKAISRSRVEEHRRKTGNARGKLHGRARSAAIAALIDAHRDEYDALLARAKYDLGLT